jgi:hypothetical protein
MFTQRFACLLFSWCLFRFSLAANIQDCRTKSATLFKELMLMIDATIDTFQTGQSFNLEKRLQFGEAKHAVQVCLLNTLLSSETGLQKRFESLHLGSHAVLPLLPSGDVH